MDLSSLSNVDLMSVYKAPSISGVSFTQGNSSVQSTGAFDSILNSAVQLVNEANDYSNAAEEEEIKFAMGESDSIHDLQIAQQKANVALQYTVAVRDSFMTGYRELMNLQF